MKKILFFTFFLISSLLFAGHGWERINYMQSTIFSAEVTINGVPASEGDVIGAFVGNECRMIAPVFMVDNKSFVSSVIHGDKKEEVEFRIWVHKNDKIFVVPEKVTTIPGGNLLNYPLKIVILE